MMSRIRIDRQCSHTAEFIDHSIIPDLEAILTRLAKEVDTTETTIEQTEECFLRADAPFPRYRCCLRRRRPVRLAGRSADRSAHPGLGKIR
jgi:hypothetical protein